MRSRTAPTLLAAALATIGGDAAFRVTAPTASFGARRGGAACRRAASTSSCGGARPSPPAPSPRILRSSASDDGASEADKLRQTASKLREEARAAEEALGSTRGTSAQSAEEGATYVKPAEYTEMGGSCWEITYRFANEPEAKEEKEGDKKKDNPPRKFFGGKLQLQFKDDGYTDIISSGGTDSNAATFQKVWGWDLETSEQDSLDYILFSADITLPPPISTSERFYFQARVDKEGKDLISLQDGSVTVKRDIESPGGGWWGIFRGADGILAQFREVGGFRCRPVAKPEAEL
ncbi:hypothetical protein ACHAXT_003978 [Thalassiosira profunda]